MLSPAITEIFEFKLVISEALGSSEARCSHESQTHHLFLADKFTPLVSVVPVISYATMYLWGSLQYKYEN